MAPPSQADRVRVDGKFFRVGDRKFFPKGVTYGPFAPDESGATFGAPDQVEKDFVQIRGLNANLVRVYYVPPRWLLDLAAQHGLKVLVDVPWEKHRCFLESDEMRESARENVRAAASACAGHAALFAFSVANEIPAEIVRWHGVRAVAEFIDELVAEVKQVDPEALCTFASFPPTEFLQPRAIDFVTFNVYLHRRPAFEEYLARLQTLANEKPLLLGEFGLDSIREGESQKAEMLQWHIEAAFRNGLAGTVLFSFTDDWFRGGQQITDWSFGLTTRAREPKQSFAVVQAAYAIAPHFPLARAPKVSVVVASYNGANTLRTCLKSLEQLNYPSYEVILVDDGSTDDTQKIALEFPRVRNIRQKNHGLSSARNAGIAASTGEVVAFTDSDCRADEDWLYYLMNDLVRSDFIGIGGHNFLPPEDSPVAAAVLVSPGGPAHVMLTDRVAEHIPGCNMAFYKWALDEIKGFDPMFRKAGDDVDVCWRLQERGYRIGFSAAGFVWHYRRATIKAYLRQQAGYGEAEALLEEKHPEYFNVLGGGIWHGRIYAAGLSGILLQEPVIYHGVFGSGFFQKLYARQPSFALMFCTSLQFQLLVTLPLLVLATSFSVLWPIAAAAFLISLGVCVAAGAQATLPPDRRRFWSRPLVALLFFLQPLVRGWARYKGRFQMMQNKPAAIPQSDEVVPMLPMGGQICFWSRQGADRYAFLQAIQQQLERCGWPHRLDTGWSDFDMEIAANRWVTARLTTAQEELAAGRRFFRCRITGRTSWWSRLLVGILAVACLVAIVLLRETQPLVWFALALIPVALLLVATEQGICEQRIASLLAGVAREVRLELWNQNAPAPPASPLANIDEDRIPS
jgi:O-antigen biosynthesis protein